MSKTMRIAMVVMALGITLASASVSLGAFKNPRWGF
jgi:hypothetical protein